MDKYAGNIPVSISYKNKRPYILEMDQIGRKNIDISVEYSYEIKRPSILYLKASDNGKKIDISLNGRVFLF